MVGEQEKIVKYSSMAAAQKAKFKPFSVETYGGLGKSARGIYRLIQASHDDVALSAGSGGDERSCSHCSTERKCNGDVSSLQ